MSPSGFLNRASLLVFGLWALLLQAGAGWAGPDLRRQAWDLVNAARLTAGLPPLAWDAELAAVAQAHSEDMARRGFFGHKTPEGRTPQDRLAGLGLRAFGENLVLDTDLTVAHRRLLASPLHRANLLNPDFDRVGVGVAPLDDLLFVTQIFGRRSTPAAPGVTPRAVEDPWLAQSLRPLLSASPRAGAVPVLDVKSACVRGSLPEVQRRLARGDRFVYYARVTDVLNQDWICFRNLQGGDHE